MSAVSLHFNSHLICIFMNVRFSSITELEIVQASFRRKYDFGYFYFRSNTQMEENLQDPVDVSVEESLVSQYKPESKYAARKLRELKQQIIDTGLHINYYCLSPS